MNHEITQRHALLDEKGRLIEPGYTKGLLMDYDRRAIKAGKLRIKEWDYYLITTDDFAVALTIDDNSYMGLDSISLLDFKEGWEKTTSPMLFMTNGKRNFPTESSKGDIAVESKNYAISFAHKDGARELTFRMKKFNGDIPIEGKIILECPPDESMVICTPWKEKDTAFYYNQKIVAMPATGEVHYGDRTYTFEKGKSFGLLDWGRGVWTYKNTWFWGAAQGIINGNNLEGPSADNKDHRFGWNIGYGFGDTSQASENMLFFDGKAHKLNQVSFNIPQKDGKDDFMSPWTFSSDDGRFEMKFVPIMDRASCTDVKLICSDQHQVFGHFTGTAILDDGTKVNVKDFLGFAEKVYNKW